MPKAHRFASPFVLTLGLGLLLGCGGTEISEEERADAVASTHEQMRAIAAALESHAVDSETGEYPTVSGIDALAEALEPTWISELPRTDGWGNAYDYTSRGRTYMVFSAGPDGKVATGDDLKIETGRPNF